MGNGYSGESVRHPTPVERDVAGPVDRVLSKEQTTNADERDDNKTDRYNTTPQSATLGLHRVINVPNYMDYYSFTDF